MDNPSIEKDYISLVDIVELNKENKRTRQNEAGESNFNRFDSLAHRQSTMIFEVENPSQYSEQSQKLRIFSFKILDVLFNEQVCNLVYMQDITEVYKE